MRQTPSPTPEWTSTADAENGAMVALQLPSAVIWMVVPSPKELKP